ncbi:MAG: VWA domain-containing protein [Saprospiraceae bacterium]|nr:VWA domain-containing protein [Saprospiraceae bacterium]
MFLNFFYTLRKQGIPVSLHEYLALMEALQKGLCDNDIDAFYALSKSLFVKNEGHLDRFDMVFGAYFKGLEEIPDDLLETQVPPEWLIKDFWNQLSEEEKEAIEKMGGLDALMERFKELLEEQDEAHNGGNKWIGKGGTSPFGAGGYNPEGFRIGGEGRQRRAIKVWEKRSFKNLDDRVELHTRNIKLILKRLRILTREGIPTELDLDGTIKKTSENAGLLDIAMQASKKNRVKVLMLMDVGGSMDDHIELCEQLFSAAKWEFKHLEFYYFHNCLYESVWTDNKRRFQERIPTLELLHKYNSDYKVIFVGDAAMSPYEIFYKGGSVEHYNDEAGIVWLRRMKDYFKHIAWINPLPEYEWDYFESVQMIRQFTGDKMFPMTVDGLTKAMQSLKNGKITYENQVWNEE